MWLFAASSHAVCLLGQDILLLGSSAQVRNSRGCATLYAGAVGSSAACRTRCSDLCYYYLACGSRVGLRPDHIHTHPYAGPRQLGMLVTSAAASISLRHHGHPHTAAQQPAQLQPGTAAPSCAAHGSMQQSKTQTDYMKGQRLNILQAAAPAAMSRYSLPLASYSLLPSPRTNTMSAGRPYVCSTYCASSATICLVRSAAAAGAGAGAVAVAATCTALLLRVRRGAGSSGRCWRAAWCCCCSIRVLPL